MAQDYEITKVLVEPYRWNVHQYARITALAAWMFFFLALGTPETYPGITGGIFVAFSPEREPFLSKRTHRHRHRHRPRRQ